VKLISQLKKFSPLALTVLLLYLVIRKVGFTELWETLSQANLFWVFVSLCHAPILIFTGVVKWKILLKSQDIDVPIWRLYALYLVGRFFNNFLPSNVGGDVIRGYELGNYTKDGAAAMASVFMERFTGFVVLMGLAVLSFLANLNLRGDVRLTLVMALAVIGLLSVFWLILDARPLALVTKWIKIPLVQKSIPKLQKFHTSLNAYRKHRRALALAFLWSLVFMVLAITNVYSSAMAFYRPIPLSQIAVIVPVILLVSMVPLTFNGLGIQEWAYVLLFSFIGLPGSVGLSAIILIRAKDLLFAILGGIVYPFIKLSRPITVLTSTTNSPEEIKPAEFVVDAERR
jgi:uncharacterized protein (TIRG00374 family)